MGTDPMIGLRREMGRSGTLVRQGSTYNRDLRMWACLSSVLLPSGPIIGSGDGEGDGEESHEAVASVGGGVGEIEVVDTSDVDSGNGGSGSRSNGDSSSALGAFRYRILYANVSYDRILSSV
ncbi:hypothetical protein Tco_1049626 [Tanacetum coccineum]